MTGPIEKSIPRYILSLGSNKEAVRLSGVNIKKWEMLAYVICGILVGIAAIFFVAAYTTVQPGYGDQYNNEAIAGCVMGGTSMAGGLASIGGTVIGVFIIALLGQLTDCVFVNTEATPLAIFMLAMETMNGGTDQYATR